MTFLKKIFPTKLTTNLHPLRGRAGVGLEVFQVLRLNKKRTALTGLSVAWGILMLIVLLGASNGLIHGFEQNLAGVADNIVTIYPGRTAIAWRGLSEGRYIALKESDIDRIVQGCRDNVEDVSPMIYGSDTIRAGQNSVSISLDGVAPLHQKVRKLTLLAGRFINQLDMQLKRKVVVLNQRAAEILFERPERAFGRTVSIGGLAYRVIGVLDGSKERNNSAEALVPFATYASTHSYDGSIHRIEITTRNLITPQQNADFNHRVREVLAQAHNFSPQDESAIWMWNTSDMREGNDMAQRALRIAVWVIGILTLISGIVSVSNITFVSVKERTHEIGIRRAIGARPSDIYIMVLSESVAITALFGLIGMLLGVIATEVGSVYMADLQIEGETLFTDPTVGLDICLEAFLTMIIAGLMAGLFPAYKATKVNPVEALGEE